MGEKADMMGAPEPSNGVRGPKKFPDIEMDCPPSVFARVTPGPAMLLMMGEAYAIVCTDSAEGWPMMVRVAAKLVHR
jgi:hypothetical protein